MITPGKKLPAKKSAEADLVIEPGALTVEIRQLIIAARSQVAQAVNVALTMLYWQIGTRIRQDILKKKRAEYGEKIVHALSAKLMPEFGNGFGEKNLHRMVQFAEVFQERGIVVSLIRQLSWTHFIALATARARLEQRYALEGTKKA